RRTRGGSGDGRGTAWPTALRTPGCRLARRGRAGAPARRPGRAGSAAGGTGERLRGARRDECGRAALPGASRGIPGAGRFAHIVGVRSLVRPRQRGARRGADPHRHGLRGGALTRRVRRPGRDPCTRLNLNSVVTMPFPLTPPQGGEYAAFYGRYIATVVGGDLRAVLADQVEVLRGACAGLSEA